MAQGREYSRNKKEEIDEIINEWASNTSLTKDERALGCLGDIIKYFLNEGFESIGTKKLLQSYFPDGVKGMTTKDAETKWLEFIKCITAENVMTETVTIEVEPNIG